VDDIEYQRLFFALWPPVSVQEYLYTQFNKKLSSWQGRQIAVSNLHLTLLFLGNVGRLQQDCLESLASQIRLPAFNLNLQLLTYHRKQQMLWLEPDRIPDALLQLVDQLHEVAQKCEIRRDIFPFKAHMTIMKKIRKPPDMTEISPYSWPVHDFVLVASKTLQDGAEYQVIKTWPLLDTD